MIDISSNRDDASVFHDVDLWNTIFGFSLVHFDPITPLTLISSTPPFLGGPATVPDSSAVEGLETSSLPAGAETIYTDSGGETVVSVIPFGSGTFIQLGFDWFESPTPVDWNDVLGRAVEAAMIPRQLVPVPSLSGSGLGILIALLALMGVISIRRLA